MADLYFPPRVKGVIAFLIGIGAFYYGILEPLQQAANHETTVELSFLLVMPIPGFLVVGVLYLIFPNWTANLIGTGKHPNAQSLYLFLPLGLIGLFGYSSVESKLKSNGYDFPWHVKHAGYVPNTGIGQNTEIDKLQEEAEAKFALLETERKGLDIKNQEAVEAFNQKVAAYQRLLSKIKSLHSADVAIPPN